LAGLDGAVRVVKHGDDTIPGQVVYLHVRKRRVPVPLPPVDEDCWIVALSLDNWLPISAQFVCPGDGFAWVIGVERLTAKSVLGGEPFLLLRPRHDIHVGFVHCIPIPKGTLCRGNGHRRLTVRGYGI